MIFRHLSRSVTSCDAPAMSSFVHSFKSWNQVIAGLPLLRLPSIFPCISLFSVPFFRTMWPKNLIFLSDILFLNIKTDSIFRLTLKKNWGKRAGRHFSFLKRAGRRQKGAGHRALQKRPRQNTVSLISLPERSARVIHLRTFV